MVRQIVLSSFEQHPPLPFLIAVPPVRVALILRLHQNRSWDRLENIERVGGSEAVITVVLKGVTVNSLLPDRVTALTPPPSARPYCAE